MAILGREKRAEKYSHQETVERYFQRAADINAHPHE
jgi:hypothetical protein